MAQYNELPVYKATYDLLLAIFQFTKEFSKEYKYTVGESLKKETIELLTLIYRANTRHQKADILQIAREQIEVIRLLIRVMKDMKQISLEKLVKINEAVENVSKQLSGWQKSQKKSFPHEFGKPWFAGASSYKFRCTSVAQWDLIKTVKPLKIRGFTFFIGGADGTDPTKRRVGPFHPEVTLQEKQKMMQRHHFTYFNMPALASKLSSPPY